MVSTRSMARTTAAGIVLAGAALVSLPGCHDDVLAAAQPESTASLGGGSPAAEAKTLTTIAKAMLSFHTDTGGWPYGETAWYAVMPPWRLVPNVQLDGLPFGPYDTALFAQPPDILGCDATHTGGWGSPCWKGPYLSGAATDALGTTPWLDQWGRQRMYAYIRPNDGQGGGIDRPESQYGLIFIWSTGPDGKDGFACTDGTCARNINQMAQGLPSQPGSDDIVIAVSNTSCATPTCTE